MTSINDITDFVRIIREQPEWADTIRGILLGQELLSLPGRFAAFVELTEQNFRLIHERLGRLEEDVAALKEDVSGLKEDVAALKEDVSGLKEDVAALKEDVSGLKEDVAALKEDVSGLKEDVAALKEDVSGLKAGFSRLENKLDTSVNQINGRLDNAFGMNYEAKVEKNIRSLAGQQIKLRRVQIQKGRAFTDLNADMEEQLNLAEESGRISPEEYNDILLLDLIITGRRRGEDSARWVGAEISITIGDNDINRAVRRSRLLAVGLDQSVIPAVIGSHIDETRSALAEANDVVVMLLPDE